MAKSKGRPPVRDFNDAVRFLSYMARFLNGDSGRNCDGCLTVLLQLEESMSEAQGRCIELAKRLETLEAREGL